MGRYSSPATAAQLDVVSRALDIAAATYKQAPRDGLAHPFGLHKEREHRWTVSLDVWAALVAHAGFGDPDRPDPTARLLGDRIQVDRSLPAGSMSLDRWP